MIKIQNKSVKIKSLRFDILDFLKEEVTIALTGEDATAQAPDTRKKHGVRDTQIAGCIIKVHNTKLDNANNLVIIFTKKLHHICLIRL